MLKKYEDIKKDILDGKHLWLAGDENLLRSLPNGNWIGGTIPYFMSEEGGQVTKEMLFATEVPEEAEAIKICFYDEKTLSNVAKDGAENGFSFIIIPATSTVHLAYAQNAPEYEDIFLKTVLGWISGVHLDDLGKVPPKVFNGQTGEESAEKAIVMHCSLPEGKLASIGIINLFQQGNGDTITFPSTGFSVTDCLVNGEKKNFAAYLKEIEADSRLPLVADYSGTMINVSFQKVDTETGAVSFYAPVFKNVEYKIAEPVSDYVKSFSEAIPKDLNTSFSCNCILNFLYSELEGKITKGMTGPITFGEIAHQLLNQTLVYLEIL